MQEEVKKYVMVPCRKRGRPSNRPDNRTLAELYFKYPVPEIARIYGVARSTVYGWAVTARKELKKYVEFE